MGILHIDEMFHPRSVAVVGASEREGSVGWAVMKNLIQGGYEGDVYPVNPRHHSLWKRQAYRSLRDLKNPVDLAVLALPIAKAPKIIKECAESEVKGAVIISAGGKETGEKGRQLESDIKKEADRSGLRIIGPNCLGIVCSKSKLNASFAGHLPLPGKMAFVSQSGAINAAVLDLSIREQIGFSYFISLGSMLDVDFGDMIDFLGGDPEVSSIVMYIEGFTRFRNFMSAARAVSRVKPLIALKSGRTRAGALAAASHTGALAGEDAVYDAAFKRAGIVRVKTFEELFDCAELLAKQPRPKGSGLVIITNAGGPGVMAADALSDYGVDPVFLSKATLEQLNDILPSHWSRGNPVDILGDASPALFRKVVEICLKDPEIDGLLIMHVPQALSDAAEVAESLAELLKGKPFPVFTSWMGGPGAEKGREIFNRAGIPTFDTPERAVRAFMDLFNYSKNLEMLQEIPPKLPKKPEFDPKKAQKIITGGLERKVALLTEVESKLLLSTYGIPVNRTEVAVSADEAVQKAEMMGFPVVMKIHSRDITHKSDVGGVQLDLKTTTDVRDTFNTMMERVHLSHPDSTIEGVTIQPMLKRPDYELILGCKKDRDFGPVVLFGMGGVMTEVIRDRSIALPPLNRLLARRLMEETKVYRLLRGYRNYPPANLALLEEILIRLSQLVTDFPEIEELDINPLMVSGTDACAADARVLLKPTQIQAPLHLVISPYPNQYEARVINEAVGELFIRPIRPEDAPLLVALFESLSPQSVYFRFFSPLKHLPHHMLARFTQIDYDREIALVAIQESESTEKMLGVGRFIVESNQKQAEFSVVVGDPWQGKGIGAELLKRCLSIAKNYEIEKVWGIVLAQNTQMLTLGRKLGFKISKVSGANEYTLSIELDKL
ncbi:MAG: bifunctional acetate--CoA ligase family protein/GNAT family N-acetyltransferase [Deltaproteobacteria bacterium]|nr:bifunctional acetate--CoA ligase family protein/GNAT family N-acetyltransferase [Deltaproteobacteria bacterium]